MRNIKFRGKRIDNGDWIVGDLVHTTKDTLILPIDGGWNQYAVNSNSIGQFTGLLDKNGNEIYEGDILVCQEDNYFFHETVIFAEGCFMAKDANITIPMCDIYEQYRSVIGNIHDTPELLK